MDNSAKRLRTGKPPLFSATVNRYNRDGSHGDSFATKTDSELFELTTIGNTGSFKYNIQEEGLISTQQLNINWADFSNHTFFNSAQVKTNIAFEKIINEFPFDGSKKDIELFIDNLTGFEKWVYDKMPKNRGYLFCSGSRTASDTGVVVTVKDAEGTQYPTVSKTSSGRTILDPLDSSMTVEMHLYVPSQTLGRKEYVISKTSGSISGFGIVNETNSGNPLSSSVSMLVYQSGLEDKVSLPVNFNTWNHLCWVWDRTPGIETIFGYKNGILTNSSSMPIEFNSFDTNGSTMYVASGSSIGTFTPNNTFSGSIDELRIWHTVRSTAEQNDKRTKPVYSDGKLKLYFKFNEPTGSNSNLVIDYSGNSLHGKINNRGITLGVREISGSFTSGDSPMINEPLSLSPVLFPNVAETTNIRLELLVSASQYDSENQNLITKLVPSHYFEEGQSQDGFDNTHGDIIKSDNINGNEPRENNLGSTQVLLSLLYTWAKFFDEMKLYIQGFSTLNKISYDETDTIPNDFLSVFARTEGIELPPLFVGSSIEQYVEGQNLDNSSSYNLLSLQNIQNQIWRRILINLQDIVRSKGTIHSIKSFIRAVGIDPDNNFRIREYGGPTKNPLQFNRETRTESSTMMNFSSSINIVGSSFTGGSPGLLKSPILVASGTSKVEPGWPYTSGVPSYDMILTSGSFTVEGTYKFPNTLTYVNSQSLGRLLLTGSAYSVINGAVIMNLVADKINNNISLYYQPESGSAANTELKLQLTGVNIFDGQKWYVSFGKQRNDDPESSSVVSSSVFIRAARQLNGEIYEQHTTGSYFLETKNSVFKTTNTQLKLGNEVPNTLTGSSPRYVFSSDGASTFFQGRVSQIRFWSKYLNDIEWKEHVRYYRSVGVQNPIYNWNFSNINVSGSWNRLRIDAATDQPTITTDTLGNILVTDFTQNNFTMTGSGFLANTPAIIPEQYKFSFISPKIDRGVSNNKVRVRGYQDPSKVENTVWAGLSPVNEVNPFEKSSDSTKLSIDFSIIDSLDQDIMTIFSSLDEFNNILGAPNLMYATEYHELEVIRDRYFNKLEDKINIKGFFEFYKWFDTNIGSFVEKLLPRKTDFLGTNFILESHLCERNKVQYFSEGIYLGSENRTDLSSVVVNITNK